MYLYSPKEPALYLLIINILIITNIRTITHKNISTADNNKIVSPDSANDIIEVPSVTGCATATPELEL
jgi:hypothetical protein